MCLNILRLRCQDADEFESALLQTESGSAVFCPTTTAHEVGAAVVVELVCKALPNRVMIKGTVQQWRPALPRLRVRAGATILFDSAEAQKVAFVIETLQGVRPPTPKRKHQRLPVALPARIRVGNDPQVIDVQLCEISVSGGLVNGMTPPPIDTDLVLEFTPPGGEAPMDLAGRVLYHAGEDGTGIRFLFREGGGSRRLREVVRRIKQA